jgi:nucleotide-binding universal stress UspA family protein
MQAVNRQLNVEQLVVPLDGSPFAQRAVAAAVPLAGRAGLGMHLLAVVPTREQVDARRAELAGLTDGHAGTSAEVVVDHDVAAAIVAVADREHAAVCMASHGAGRSAAVIGSVASQVLAQHGSPAVIVGPRFADSWTPQGPVLACVDGSTRADAVVEVAVPWARALGEAVTVLTVAEPVLAPTPGGHWHRGHGPDADADAYVAALAERWSHAGARIDATAVYDPISVTSGLTLHLRNHPASMIVVGTRGRRGVSRLALGSVAAEIIQHVPVPVLTAALASAR